MHRNQMEIYQTKRKYVGNIFEEYSWMNPFLIPEPALKCRRKRIVWSMKIFNTREWPFVNSNSQKDLTE